jgi:hypothetical protein
MSKKRTTGLSLQELLVLKKGDFTVRHVKDEDIDFSDLPELTDEQLKQFKRAGPVIQIEKKARPPKKRKL